MYSSRTRTYPLPPECFTPDGTQHPRWTSLAFWQEMVRVINEDAPKLAARNARQRAKRAEERERRQTQERVA